jgi:hypothetical protein
VSFGAFYINGLQTGLPGGNQQSLGPFAIPFADVQAVYQEVLGSGANYITPPQPADLSGNMANGVWIIPPDGNTVTLLLQGAPTDTGFYINPQTPTYLPFDTVTPNYPAQIVLTASGAVTIVLQFV